MKRTREKFKYVELIKPLSLPEEVNSLIERCSNRIERARHVCKWVASIIEDSETGTDIEEVLSERKGTCLGKCALAVSWLRTLSFTEEEAFVTILVRKGENPFEALHALVYLYGEGVFFDLTDGFHEYVKSLNEILLTNTVVLMFNDKVCLVP